MGKKMNIKNYIRNYKFNSLFLRNLIRIFLLMMIPLAGAGVIAYFSYSHMQKNEIYAYGNEITGNVYDDLQNIFKSSQNELIYIGFNSNVELYMYGTQETQQFNQRIRAIQDLIRLPVISRDYVNDIYIYSYTSGHIITLNSFESYEVFSQRSCLDEYLEGGRTESALLLTEKDESGYASQQLSLFEPVHYGKNTLGVTCMNFDMDELDTMLTLPEKGTVYLTDGQKILYSNRKEMIGEKRSAVPGVEGLTDETPVLSGKNVMTLIPAEESPLEIITSLSLDGYQDQLNSIRIFMFIFFALMLVAVFLLTLYVSIKIFRPIDEIIQEIQKSRTALIEEDKLFREHDELSYILSTIQKTSNSNKDAGQELTERVHLLKKAQAVALQSQINPHFLNNTLNTINWISISLLGGNNQISEMITALSKMFRMSLENTDSIIPLSQEIEHCNSYIEIQNIRYEGRYRIEWAIPEELYRCKTIRIVLQPVVENAIYHGVKYLSANGLITISGRAENDVVELSVKDNGLGMSARELEELRVSLREESIRESRHIGLANVNQRIRLYFGNEYGVSIESQEGKGTEVLIRFPRIL